MLALGAQRRAPSLPRDEAALLLAINQAFPADLQRRYDKLIARRDAEALTAAEHAELLELSDKIEQFEAERDAALSNLAILRGIILPELMRALGIQQPAHA